MKRRVNGIVEKIVSERPGIQELLVRQDASPKEKLPQSASGREGRSYEPIHAGRGEKDTTGKEGAKQREAINLIELTGRVAVGDRVVLNTVAVELGLGTGGKDFVVAVLHENEPSISTPGHILKLRYTPLQTPVLAVEAPESEGHDALCQFETLNELPVVCAQLHSQLPAIIAGVRWAVNQHGKYPQPRIAYIQTEGAALPLALSRLVPALRQRDWICATITAGQAFGGEYECVNLYSALATASDVVRADMVIVCQGPGNVGTGTPLGFSGIEQGQAINAAASLGGNPIAVARISFADARQRHMGLSHHTLTVLQKVALASALVALPRLPEEEMRFLLAAIEEGKINESHETVVIMADGAFEKLKHSGFEVTTMGRGLDADRPFFLSACAAGVLAGQLLEARYDSR